MLLELLNSELLSGGICMVCLLLKWIVLKLVWGYETFFCRFPGNLSCSDFGGEQVTEPVGTVSAGDDLNRRLPHRFKRLNDTPDRVVELPGKRVAEAEDPALLRHPDSQMLRRNQHLRRPVVVETDERGRPFLLRQAEPPFEVREVFPRRSAVPPPAGRTTVRGPRSVPAGRGAGRPAADRVPARSRASPPSLLPDVRRCNGCRRPA